MYDKIIHTVHCKNYYKFALLYPFKELTFVKLFQMLKTVAFENCAHFKDTTIIYLNSKNNKSKVGVNNLNIFVGANFCGKSTVLELIR